MSRHKYRWLLLLLASASLLGVIWAGYMGRPAARGDWAEAPPAVQALLWPGPRLPNTAGLKAVGAAPWTADQLRGRWSLVYFGYLSCPDICPMTLQNMRGLQTLSQREDSALNPQLVFVSVDPSNDSAERIASYLDFFGGEIVGLRAEPEPLKQLTDSLGVMYAEFVDDAGVRSVDHTTSVIVIGPSGEAVGALPPPHQPETMLQQFELLANYVGSPSY